jgi:putative spermidine/putrescine transport system substrate-binding protein
MSELDGLDFDPSEYADQLGYTDELGRGDYSDPTLVRAETPEERRRGMTRRELLVKGGLGAAALTTAGSFAGSAAARLARPERSGAYTGTLNVISLGVEWPAGAQDQAEKDLGVKFNVQLLSTNAQVQKSITAPSSFDIGGLYNYQMFPIWPTGNLQPVDRTKFKYWNQFYPLFTKGKVNPKDKGATYGQGNAPFRVMFIDPQGSSGGIGTSTGLPLTKTGSQNNRQIVQWWDESKNAPYKGKAMPKWVVGGTAHFNMDSMGYDGSVITKAPNQVHWGELLNPAWKGRVALLNDPGIAMQDAGNAVKQLGLMKFKDIGNMTRAEIDGLVKLLIKYKKQGQFRAFWSTFNESVNLMASKQVVIESMWSPAVALLTAQGVNVRYAFPPEGMRGWSGCQSIPTHVTGDKLQAVYDYINWTNEGFLGALIMRQGYYVANGKTLPKWLKSAKASEGKPAFTMDEYDFWYNGKPAAKDLPGITGHVGDIKKGETRDGGSFVQRSRHYSSWNSFFNQSVYQVKRFNDFLSA